MSWQRGSRPWRPALGDGNPTPPRSGHSGDPGTAPVAFWAHQAVEYLLALLLVLTAVHLPGRSAAVAGVAAAALAALSASTDGPLGAWKLLSRRAHALCDWVLVILLVAAPLALPVGGLVGVAVSEAVACAMAVLVRRSAYLPAQPRSHPDLPSGTASGQSPTQMSLRVAGFALGRARRHGSRALGRFAARWTKP